jgi:hypothetical protein
MANKQATPEGMACVKTEAMCSVLRREAERQPLHLYGGYTSYDVAFFIEGLSLPAVQIDHALNRAI